MRTLILIIFTVMCLGTINAQNTFSVDDTVYEVVDKDFNHVWDENTGVPFHLTNIDTQYNYLYFDTDIPNMANFTHDNRPPVGNRPDELPVLWIYENGGNVRLPIPNANQGELFIPLNGLNNLSMFWYWPRSAYPGNELLIGKAFHTTR